MRLHVAQSHQTLNAELLFKVNLQAKKIFYQQEQTLDFIARFLSFSYFSAKL